MHVRGRRRDTHTADKVLTHGQTLLLYRWVRVCGVTAIHYWTSRAELTNDAGFRVNQK